MARVAYLSCVVAMHIYFSLSLSLSLQTCIPCGESISQDDNLFSNIGAESVDEPGVIFMPSQSHPCDSIQLNYYSADSIPESIDAGMRGRRGRGGRVSRPSCLYKKSVSPFLPIVCFDRPVERGFIKEGGENVKASVILWCYVDTARIGMSLVFYLCI